MSTRQDAKIKDVSHVRICGGKDLYCAHPRQRGLFNFGGGELVLGHSHATWDYHRSRPRHGFGSGYKSRSQWVIQRSGDAGRTWPEEESAVIYDESRPLEERRRLLEPGRPRLPIDLGEADSMVVFGRTMLGRRNARGRPVPSTVALRSPDRGRTWEDAATLIEPPAYLTSDVEGYARVTMPGGLQILAATVTPPSCMVVYGSDDDGLSWQYLSEVARSSTGRGGMYYPGLILLPDGRLQAYMLEIEGATNAILVSESRDAYAWSPPRPIVRWGRSPWRGRIARGAAPPANPFPSIRQYRSPWPLLLGDGRIVVVFARRKPPYGIGAVLSEDEGRTWSDEFIVRDDASGTDLGYCVAAEIEPGRVFAAYYFMVADGNPHGGSRFIAGSAFSL